MLMGCRELHQQNAHNAIIEGGSFSAIQWGSGAAKCPWWLADWVEEIKHISTQLQCCFLHVLREANGIADGLARERVYS